VFDHPEATILESCQTPTRLSFVFWDLVMPDETTSNKTANIILQLLWFIL
jgi:hypothetical protein